MNFNERVINCITRSIDAKYGEGVRQVLFWKFQDVTNLEVSDIPIKPQLFVECIQRIFGVGSRSIERTITDETCREFKLASLNEPNFVRAVELAKSKWLKEELTDR